MSFSKSWTSCCGVLLALILFAQPSHVNAQINTVDFDLQEVIQCVIRPDGDGDILENDTPLRALLCDQLLELFIDQLLEAEGALDQIFAGYRDDIPIFIQNQLADQPVLLNIRIIDEIDGVGGTLAQAGPDTFVSLVPNPFLRRRGGFRAWVIPRLATVDFDLPDLPFLLLTEDAVEVAFHEALHALGFPSAFDMSGLNGATSVFGQINFIGDEAGINNVGFGIQEFRSESANPLATFIPLSQQDMTGHLSLFEPTFNSPGMGFQEVFIPFAAPPGVDEIMTRSLRGMFADLGYKIRGINTPGIIDLDFDGMDDVPLVIDPLLADEIDP